MNDRPYGGLRPELQSWLRFYLTEIVVFALGVFFYAAATLTTFTTAQFAFSRLDPLVLVLGAVAAGLFSIVIGYWSMVFVGGHLSLAIARTICRLTGARQAIRVVGGEHTSSANALLQRAYFAYASPLVFALSVALGWDLYNADGPKASILEPAVHALDAFARPGRVSLVRYSLDLLPVLLVLVALGGLVPSVVLPYFRKFRVTGVNGSPFHTGFLTTVGGFIMGLSVVLALVGLVYDALWANKGPLQYHYSLLVMVGLSLHYALGTYMARDKSEAVIEKALRSARHTNLVFLGSVELKPD